MKFTKNLSHSHWLKGGIIGIIIDLVVLLLFVILTLLQIEGAQYLYWILFYVPFAIIVLLISVLVGVMFSKIKK